MKRNAVPAKRRKAQEGAIGGIPEAIVTMAVLGILLVGLTSLFGPDEMFRIRCRAAADYMIKVQKAAYAYISDNYTTVFPWAATPQQLTVAALQAAGYMDPGVTSTNAFGQNVVVLVRQVSTSPQQIEAAVVSSGGLGIPSEWTGFMVGLLGGDGGVYPYAVDVTSCTGVPCLAGAGGQFKMNLANFGSATPAMVSGDIGMGIFYQSSLAAAQFLSRVYVPNCPACTTEYADTYWNGGGTPHNMNDVGIITANDVEWVNGAGADVTVRQAFSFGGIYYDGQVVAQPSCPAYGGTTPGNMSPEGYAVPVEVSDNGLGYPIIGYSAYLTSSGTNWTVNLLVGDQNGYQHVGSSFGAVAVFSRCV